MIDLIALAKKLEQQQFCSEYEFWLDNQAETHCEDYYYEIP